MDSLIERKIYTHNKKTGEPCWVLRLNERITKDEFRALNNLIRVEYKGWISFPKGQPARLWFMDLGKLHDFLDAKGINASEFEGGPVALTSAPMRVNYFAPRVSKGPIRLLKQAERMIDKAEAEIAQERQENTARRARMASDIRQRARGELELGRKIVRFCDNFNDAQILSRVNTKKHCITLDGWILYPTHSVHDGGVFDVLPADIPSAVEEWKRLTSGADKAPEEDPVKKINRDLIGMKIPGFFQTPEPLVEVMLNLANIQKGMRVLEPSAGAGAIARALRSRGAELVCFEYNYMLAKLLEAQNISATRGDFLTALPGQLPIDAVVMNPPFEKGQDTEHVQHAYHWLKPGGGVLVSIMCEGPFFRVDKKSVAFINWLSSVGGQSYQLPPNTFKESGTSVATRIVIIRK
jgi:predicted RNA methylase